MTQRYRPRWLATRALAFALAAFSAPTLADWAFEGRVVGVSDGDTITVLDDAKVQHKIRLVGVDVPEKGQAFGERSKQRLSDLVFQKRVQARCHKKDRYKREVCAVFVDSLDAGLDNQLRTGMAWCFREYAKEQRPEDRGTYQRAEDAARAARAGLWADAKPVPPWDWRRKTNRE
jgi:endonuclease YncB( thermonuclease family)